jgi:hypothetical protein
MHYGLARFDAGIPTLLLEFALAEKLTVYYKATGLSPHSQIDQYLL